MTRKGDEHELTFILFNDLLCYASKQSIGVPFKSRRRSQSNGNEEDEFGSMRLQMRMPIDDVFHVKDVYDEIPMEKYNGRAFEIHSSVKSIIVYAKDMKEKAEWLLSLTQCFEKIQKGIIYNGKIRHELSSAVWIPDDWSNYCMVDDCKKKFNSLTTRRHHCRWCGKLICSTCGKYKLAHKIHKNSMVKPVCKECYNRHHSRFRANTNAVLYNEEEMEDDEDMSDEQEVIGIDENSEM